MKHRIFFFVLSLGLCTTAFAQPRVGQKMDEFQLRGTDDRLYGVSHSSNTISILHFVGHN